MVSSVENEASFSFTCVETIDTAAVRQTVVTHGL